MLWQLMGVVKLDWAAVLLHDDSMFGDTPTVPMVYEDGEQKWRPAWTLNVDSLLNDKYIHEVVRQVRQEEDVRTFLSYI